MNSLFSVHKQTEFCPKCGSILRIRQSKRGLFLSCSSYPDCDYLKPLHHSQLQIIQELAENCPQCGANLQLKQGSYGMFIGCRAYPDCGYILRQTTEQAETFPCPLCRKGLLVLRRNRLGKTFYGCNQYPKCKMIIAEKPMLQTCPHCESKLARLKKITSDCQIFQCINPHCEQRFERPLSCQNNVMNFQQIIDVLFNDEVIAYPTEAVFGLGCNPYSETAIQKLLALKKRPKEKGLILIAPSLDYLMDFIDIDALLPEQLTCLAKPSSPAITWLVPAKAMVSPWILGKFTRIAIRLCSHPDVIKLCKATGLPLISTSANLSGQSPARTVEEVRQQFGKNFPVLNGQVGDAANPSQIQDLVTKQILRQG